MSSLRITAAGLAYEYTPPVQQQQYTYHMLKKERAPELVFVPDQVVVLCDPGSCEQIIASSFTGLKEAKLDQTDPALQKEIATNDGEVDKARRENPFSGFRRPYEPDRSTWFISIRKKGDEDHWLSLDYDNYEPREVSVFLTDVGTLYRYHSEKTRNSGITPYDLEMRPDADGRDYDLLSLVGTVEMGFGDGETLNGDIVYGLKTKRELRELPFSIARIFQTEEKKETKNPQMTINALQDGEGNDLTWVRTSVYSGLVVLPKPVPKGTNLTLRLQFENKDSIFKLTPAFSYVDRGGWLPLVRFGDMIDTFDLTVKVPAKHKTLGIGKLVSEEKKDGVSTTRWVASSPVSFPTVIYGSYIEEASKVKAKKKDGTEIPVNIHLDRDSVADNDTGALVDTGGTGAGVQVVTLKVTRRSATKFVNDAANALNLYREIFGTDYPYDKLDLVNDPLGGFYGQAPSSVIYLGNPDFFGKGAMSGALEFGSSLSTFQDSVVAHEVAHQWWGSSIAMANFDNYWFVESLAEYSSALFTENVYGKAKYQEHIDAWRKEILEADMRGSVQDGYTVWQGPGGFGPYRAALYAKGPYAFHIMRSTWGDEAFFKFLKTLATDLKGKEIVTRDIQKIAEKSFGANLDWFFDQWLRGVGLPEFTFNYSARTAEDGSTVVEGTVTQRTMMKPAMAIKEQIPGKPFTGIIPITVVGKSGKEYRKRIIIESASTPFKFSIPEKPKDIIFNKYGESLGYDVVVKTAS